MEKDTNRPNNKIKQFIKNYITIDNVSNEVQSVLTNIYLSD